MKSKTNSAFVAFQQLDLDFEGSDTEDVQGRKDKQRQKKRQKSKKKNTENSELKGLAMLPTKKGKGKNKTKTPAVSSPELAAIEADDVVEEAVAETPAVPQPEPQAATTTPVWPVRTSTAATVAAPPASAPTPVPTTKAAKAPKTTTKATSSTASPPATSAKKGKKSPTTPQTDADSGDDDDTASSTSASGALGVTYTPTQITVTSLDGSVSRQVAVHEMMDQLLRFQQQHQQDVVVKEQLQVANRNLAEQLQQGAGIISSLKNEVSMFRQMCLNLQAEVTQLRMAPAAFAAGSVPPHLNSHAQPHAHAPPPPPGMS